MRAAIIVNPSKVPVTDLRAALAVVEYELGWEPSLVLAEAPEMERDALTREALDANVDVVVACGGDGTVRLVAGELAAHQRGGAHVPMGLVPRGTGNLLARNLGINPELPLGNLLRDAFIGTDERIDLCLAEVVRTDGTLDPHWFAVAAGIGLDAGMIKHTDSDLKARIGWPAYVGGIVRSLQRQPEFTARFRIDNEPTYGVHAASLMVANCGMLQAGVSLFADARPDDGKLDVLVMRPKSAFGWLHVGAFAVLNTVARLIPPLRRLLRQATPERQVSVHPASRHLFAVTSAAGRAVHFSLDTEPEPFQVDGDLIGEIVAANIMTVPGALTVRS